MAGYASDDDLTMVGVTGEGRRFWSWAQAGTL